MIDHKLVGTASQMRGSTGFTIACFKRAEVPEGTPLYSGVLAEIAPNLLHALKMADMNSKEPKDEPWRVVVKAAIAACA